MSPGYLELREVLLVTPVCDTSGVFASSLYGRCLCGDIFVVEKMLLKKCLTILSKVAIYP